MRTASSEVEPEGAARAIATKQTDEEEFQGEQNNILTKIVKCSFQFDSQKEDQPPPPAAQDKSMKLVQTSNSRSLSEENAHQIRIRAIRMARKATSPRLMVTHQGSRIPMLLDEGAEVNAMDGDYAEQEPKIRLEKSMSIVPPIDFSLSNKLLIFGNS